jgi:hypothetical protein
MMICTTLLFYPFYPASVIYNIKSSEFHRIELLQVIKQNK